MTELAVAVPDAPRARYALGVLLDLLGLTARPAQPGERIDLAHGMNLSARCSMPATAQEEWDDPEPEVTWDSGLPIIHRRGDAVRARTGERELGFDVLFATYACLTAPWERVDPSDEVGCPVAAEGFLARNGLLLEPLVHRYASLLASCLDKEPQRKPRIVITHDVDNNFGHVFRRRESMELLRRDLTEAARRRPACCRPGPTPGPACRRPERPFRGMGRLAPRLGESAGVLRRLLWAVRGRIGPT